MGFPWEVDEQRDFKRIHAREGYRRKKRNFERSKKLTYRKCGHPIWYPQYLRTAHWRLFKERWRNSGRSRRCMICGDFRYELHHWTYERVGREQLDDVVPLCRAHHLRAHALEKKGVPLAEAHLRLATVLELVDKQE